MKKRIAFLLLILISFLVLYLGCAFFRNFLKFSTPEAVKDNSDVYLNVPAESNITIKKLSEQELRKNVEDFLNNVLFFVPHPVPWTQVCMKVFAFFEA